MPEPLFDVPNLDALSVDHEDLIEAARVFELLARYARETGFAMRARKRGFIATAQQHERAAERAKKAMPGWAQNW